MIEMENKCYDCIHDKVCKFQKLVNDMLMIDEEIGKLQDMKKPLMIEVMGRISCGVYTEESEDD